MARIRTSGGEFDLSDLGFDPDEPDERFMPKPKRAPRTPNEVRRKPASKRSGAFTKPKSIAALKGKQALPDIKTIYRVATGDQAERLVQATAGAQEETGVTDFQPDIDEEGNMRVQILSAGLAGILFEQSYLPRFYDTNVAARVFNVVVDQASRRLTNPTTAINLGKVGTHKVVNRISLETFEAVHFEIGDDASRGRLVSDNLAVQHDFKVDSRHEEPFLPYKPRLVIGLARNPEDATAIAGQLGDSGLVGVNLVLGPSRAEPVSIA